MAKGKTYEDMELSELEKARAQKEAELAEISKAQREYRGRKAKEMRATFEEMASKEGFSLEEIMGGSGGKKKNMAGRAKAPAKYRHPENASLTWSGRGRQPQWYKDHLENGGKADDLAI